MSNELSMAERATIAALLKQGWSKRRIARELGLHRDTVRRHASELARQTATATAQSTSTDSKQATPVEVTTGSADSKQATPAEVTTGSVEPPSRSKCEPYRQVIEQKAEAGLTAQRIYQDLTTEHGYKGAYEAVKRMVRRLCAGEELPFRRLESAPGAEAQVDFGVGAPVLDAAGKRRRTHVLRLGLSFSRKAYSEAVFQQTTDNLLACLENAFLYWGGVPRTLVIDNLRAAVTQPDWYDPELHPKISAFAQHYGTTVWPTKSYTPRHKGKIESGINYVKENALKGRVFPGLAEEIRRLQKEYYDRSTADPAFVQRRQTSSRLWREKNKDRLRAEVKLHPLWLLPRYWVCECCGRQNERRFWEKRHAAVCRWCEGYRW